MDGQEGVVASSIESILLVAAEPVSIRTLARLLETDSRGIERGVDFLATELEGRGVRVQTHNGKLQLVTAPENAEIVREFLRLPRQPRLSRPSLETLAIISYRQPVTRSEIEEIRGVSADRVVASLLARGLIEERGRRATPGRPMLYGTTSDFLELFGLSSLDDLPPPESPPKPRQTSFTVLGMTDPHGEAIS